MTTLVGSPICLVASYPIVYINSIQAKIRDAAAVRVRAVCLALGVDAIGDRGLLGLSLAQTEGAKFWLPIVTELKTRSVQDIFIVCVDGLKGLPEAIEAVLPRAAVHLRIVHVLRQSLHFFSWKVGKVVVANLCIIFSVSTVEEAKIPLTEFDAKWGAGAHA